MAGRCGKHLHLSVRRDNRFLAQIQVLSLLRAVSASRFFDSLLHLAEFLLNLPDYLFANAFSFEAGVVRQLSNFYFFRSPQSRLS